MRQPLSSQFRPLFSAQLHLGSFGRGSVVSLEKPAERAATTMHRMPAKCGTAMQVQSGDGFSLAGQVPLPLALIGVTYPRVDVKVGASLGGNLHGSLPLCAAREAGILCACQSRTSSSATHPSL